MALKEKRAGAGLAMRSFVGKRGKTYLVFKTAGGSFHVFVETEAKAAARECGAKRSGNTRQLWAELWDRA